MQELAYQEPFRLSIQANLQRRVDFSTSTQGFLCSIGY